MRPDVERVDGRVPKRGPLSSFPFSLPFPPLSRCLSVIARSDVRTSSQSEEKGSGVGIGRSDDGGHLAGMVELRSPIPFARHPGPEHPPRRRR